MARILVVEDDAHILRLLSIWLNRNGHQVVEASDGLQAKEELLRVGFDLVVTDVNMPGLDGISLVRWLRAEHQSEVPVILLSSRSDQSAIAEELGSLGVRVQPKPFSPSRLMGAIDRELASRAGAL